MNNRPTDVAPQLAAPSAGCLHRMSKPAENSFLFYQIKRSKGNRKKQEEMALTGDAEKPSFPVSR